MAEGQKKGEIATRADGATVRDHARDAGEVAPATLRDIGVTSQRLAEARDIARAMDPGQIDALVAEANDPGRTLSGSAVLKEVRTGAGSATASRRISARSTAGAPSSPTG